MLLCRTTRTRRNCFQQILLGVIYNSSTAARQHSITFTPMGSLSCPWTHYLLSHNSPAVIKAIDPCFTTNTATQWSWWLMLELHAQALSCIKISFSTSTSPFFHIQLHKGGAYLLQMVQLLDPPTLLPYLHRDHTDYSSFRMCLPSGISRLWLITPPCFPKTHAAL